MANNNEIHHNTFIIRILNNTSNTKIKKSVSEIWVKKIKVAVAKPAYRKRILIESFEQSERSLQRLRRWFGN